MTDLVQLFEKRILTTIRLTQNQMQVMAMILASPEGNLPDEDISKGPNLKQARDLLIQLDMITNDGENKYSVTDKGQKVAKDENIVDNMGGLTEFGQGLAYPDEDKKEPDPTSPGPGSPSDFPAPDAFAQVSTEIAEPGLAGPAESVKRKGTLLQEIWFAKKQKKEKRAPQPLQPGQINRLSKLLPDELKAIYKKRVATLESNKSELAQSKIDEVFDWLTERKHVSSENFHLSFIEYFDDFFTDEQVDSGEMDEFIEKQWTRFQSRH